MGIPSSSSHTLIGSILGVGLANQLLSSGPGGTSGVEWGQAQNVLLALLVSPLLGFDRPVSTKLRCRAEMPAWRERSSWLTWRRSRQLRSCCPTIAIPRDPKRRR